MSPQHTAKLVTTPPSWKIPLTCDCLVVTLYLTLLLTLELCGVSWSDISKHIFTPYTAEKRVNAWRLFHLLHSLVCQESKRSSQELSGRSDGNVKVIFPKQDVTSLHQTPSHTQTIRPGDYVLVKVHMKTLAARYLNILVALIRYSKMVYVDMLKKVLSIGSMIWEYTCFPVLSAQWKRLANSAVIFLFVTVVYIADLL